FDTDGGSVTFRNNTADGKANDVYMDADGVLNISGSNKIKFEGGIVTSSINVSGIEINKSGSGEMYLGGNSEIWGDFNISGGDIIMLASATYRGKALELGSSALDMHNGTVNKIEVDGKFESKTDLKIDIFSSGANDEIKAGSADIDGNIDIFAGVGTYKSKEYHLIITSNNLTGVFTSSALIPADNKKLNYELRYEDGIVKLIVDGLMVTKFEDLCPLTYNQSETAGAFKKISENPGDWEQILNDMVIKQNNGTDAETSEVKDFLAQTSGYFLSNVIRNMAADSPNNEVYDKIRNHREEYETNSGLWVQLKGGMESFKKDENSLEDYRDVSMGVMFGFDRFIDRYPAGGDIMWGVYGRINKDNIEQGKHKADGNKNGLGLYGGYIKENWELKAMLLGSYDKFNTERMTYGGNYAKADITALTMSADVEAVLKTLLTENIEVRNYAGIEMQSTMYGGFKEKGAGMYNLEVSEGNYLRSAARLGMGLDYEKGKWIWYANVEGKYMIEGTKSEIESKFENTGAGFYSRGSEEGKAQIGVGLGGEVKIAENWKAFANVKYYAAERYENLYGNAGVRYMFGKKESEEEPEVNDTQAELEEAESQEMLRQNEERKKIAEEEEARRDQEKRIEKQMMEEDARRAAALEKARRQAEIDADNEAAMEKAREEARKRREKPVLKSFSMDMASFAVNSAKLSEKAKANIALQAQEIKQFKYQNMTIEGHTDKTGSVELNKRLSTRRAKAVYDEFVINGIPEEKLSYIGFASTMPKADNKTAAGRAQNRRVEIFVE
ncbi:MAG: autotransporter domain-containing protein, partial [Endomicrobia bacterium]|nr:autotransporter domain-containing protein [Endomicrobiia bacterium]